MRVLRTTKNCFTRSFIANTIILTFFAGALTAVPAQARGSKSNITWEPVKLVGGSPVLFRVSAPRAESVSAEWIGHQVIFFRNHSGNQWCALAGIPVETAAGSYVLRIKETLPNGMREIVKKIVIGAARYPKIEAHVATKFTEPNPEQLKQISADKGLKEVVLATNTPDRQWKGSFEPPVSSPVSDIFGTERVFNGQIQSRHLGLDFAAPAGTAVHAINSGTVILAQPLYFEGGFVVIDHGQGLLSLYLHLSDFLVKQGDQVTYGQVIGSSGSSGRATGPHLHLAVRWQGEYLDPAVFLHLNFQ